MRVKFLYSIGYLIGYNLDNSLSNIGSREIYVLSVGEVVFNNSHEKHCRWIMQLKSVSLSFCNHKKLLNILWQQRIRPLSRLGADEISGKLKDMEHHASSLSSLIWHWLLIPLGEPPVTFVTAFPEGRSNHRKEVSVLVWKSYINLVILRPLWAQ